MGRDERMYGGMLDSITGAKVGMDIEHYKVHDGHHYTVGDFTTGSLLSATVDVIIRVGASDAHLSFEYNSDLLGRVQLFEAGTTTDYTTTATPLTVYNNYRASSNTPSVAFYPASTATVVSTGAMLFNTMLCPGRPHMEIPRNQEFRLKPSTDYLLRFIADTASVTSSWQANFYTI